MPNIRIYSSQSTMPVMVPSLKKGNTFYHVVYLTFRFVVAVGLNSHSFPCSRNSHNFTTDSADSLNVHGSNR
nr:hypothetical protein CFP56_74788 [Quercus suber]